MASFFWNELEVKPPPTLTSRMTAAEVSHADLRKISDTCWNALTVLKNQELLFTEAATLSRLIYRMKSMFRGDKGFKSIEKVNHCLRHFLSLNLVPIYDNFFRTIPWDCSDKELYCPTRQMLEHVLLRTQGLAALLCRVVHTCLEAASLFKSRMSSGHNWQVSLLCLGAVSRIWALVKHVMDACVKWYNVMLPFLNKFQPKGPSWLPEGYTFPSDLTKWLVVPWMGADESPNENQFNSSEETSMNLCSDSSKSLPFLSSHVNPKIMSIHDDVGVSLSRESLRLPPAPTQNLCEDVLEETSDAKYCGKVGETSRRLNQRSKKKALKSKLVEVPNKDEELPIETEEIVHDALSKNHSSVSMGEQERNIKTKVKKKLPKINNNNKALVLSIKSQTDVQRLLDNETRKRSFTNSLGDKQWLLLKRLVGKLNLKLRKTGDEKKKQQLLEQIRKAFKIALS